MTNLLQTLGLAYKGKRILIGEDVIKDLPKNKIKLIILANDVSENTLKRYQDKANHYQVELIQMFSKEELGQALGKDLVAAIGIKDENLKNKVLIK